MELGTTTNLNYKVMEAKEAPEKIYIPTILAANTVRYKEEGSIEYTRTDAVIERVIRWIDYNNRNGGCNFDGWEKDIKNYMKGE